MCVPLVVTGILLNCLRLFQQGDHPCAVSDGPTKRPQYMRISGLISQTYKQFYLRIPSWALLVTRTRCPAFASVLHRQMCIVALDVSIWSWRPRRL